MNKFIPECLENIRKYRGLSQTALASAIKEAGIKGVNQSAVSKFEKGELLPSEEALKSIAEVLDFPIRAFYRHLKTSSVISTHAYRKSSAIKQKELYKIHAEMEMKAYFQQTLNERLKVEKKYDFSIFKGLDVVEASKKFRQLVGEPSNTPIKNLTKLIESVGIDIFLIETNVDGVTLNYGDNYRAIFIGSKQPADRYRFSLAHELGHYLLHSDLIDTTKEMEDEANDFAAELLMPEEGINKYLSTMNLNDFAKLKKEWRVSMGALIFRAKTLGCINKNQSTELWKQMSIKGFRKKEPVSIAMEKPKRVNQFLFDISKEVNKQKIHEVLGLSRDDFISFYPNYEDLDDEYVDWLL